MAIGDFAPTYLTRVSNESDAAQRQTAIEELFHPNLRYIDLDGLVDGRDAFVDRISFLASLVQPDHTFVLLRPASRVADTVLFRWALKAPRRSPAVTGTNVAVFHVGTASVVQMYAVTD